MLMYIIVNNQNFIPLTMDMYGLQGLVIGGKDLKFEWNRLKSCNIVVCTPGRLVIN